MTFLEKAMEMDRSLSREEIIDDYCPSSFGFPDEKYARECSYECASCWNREIPDASDIEDSITPEKIEELKKEEQRIIEKFNEIPEEYLVTKEDLEKILVGHPDPVGEPGEPGIPHILDSDNRRQFETGAVRDIQEGKGRCDLMPLDVIRDFFYLRSDGVSKSADYKRNRVFGHLSNFVNTGDEDSLHKVLFAAEMFKDPFDMFLEVAIHFEEGAKKYGENNWQKGIPVHCYIDSAVRHYLKYLRGDKDEPHDRAFCWNLMCAIWTCKHKPELNDYANTEV